jgi:tetratricopeptide (TPR) repeat protein
LRERHRWKAAIRSFERAVESEPENAEAHFWLAVTLDNRGQESDAIPAYQRALSLGLDRKMKAKALTWLASSLSKTGQHAEALKALAAAEQAGGYEPRSELERVKAAIRRRSG